MIVFESLHTMLDNANKLNPVEAWIFAIDKSLREDIVFMNTFDQLFGQGIDSLGDGLGDYSTTSVNVFGKRPGHITLQDTGEFYDSFNVTVQKDSFTIDADPEKEDDNLFAKYGIDIVGLTDKNMETIKIFIRENYIKYINGKLL